jgi:16S rRNA A1518/A1519 N6-dimethyltransferase RsmA/KsgA/DIM1 with predicted DNA glycosylase/AP lyase activity
MVTYIPTSPWLAAQMATLADIQMDDLVLEPSAGEGMLILAMRHHRIVAVEISARWIPELNKFGILEVHRADFLTWGYPKLFDKIVMNPPFEADIAHIKRALTMLKPCGRLVTLCSNKLPEREQLKPLASSWTEIQPELFHNVEAALITIDGEP